MYNENNKVMKEDKDNNILINFRNSMKVREWLDFDFSVMTQIKKETSGGVGLDDIKQMSAYETLLDENGNYAHVASVGDYMGGVKPRTLNMEVVNKLHQQVDGWSYDNLINNPLQNMRSQDLRTKTINHRISGGLNIKISEGIRWKSSFQYEREDVDTKNRYKEDSYYTRSLVNRYDVTDYDILVAGDPYTITEHQVPKGEIAYLLNMLNEAFLVRNQFSFNKTYGKHSFNYIAGTELRWNTRESKDDWLYGYNHEKFTNKIPEKYNGLYSAYSSKINTTSLPRGGVMNYGTDKFFSLYSNLAYTFKDKYTLSGSVRTDASNLVVDDPKYRYSPFWSVGASWQLGKEDFVENYEWLNRLTLRTTYGVNGNSPGESARVPLIRYVSGNEPSSGAGVDFAEIQDFGNPTLGWEKVKQLNIAVDFAVLGNKLFGSIEYYKKNSEELLAKISLPSTDGTSSQYFNGANMENKGFEVNLNGNFTIGTSFSWKTTLNFAHNKNKVTSVKEVDITLWDLYSKTYVEGYAMFPLWSYKLNGLNDEGIPTIIGRNGVVYDANTNIAATGVFAPDLLWNRGSRIAPTVTSLTNEFSYKGISLLATITGKFGHKMNNKGFSYGTRSDTQNYHENLNQIIQGKHQEVGEFPLPDEIIPNYTSYSGTSLWLDSRIEDASYIRLKEIMLSYEMPSSVVSKIGSSGVRIYAHVSNVGLLWTANDKGIDPNYPKGTFFKPERTYTLGINLKF